MGVTRQISEHRRRSCKGAFGIDHPFAISQRREPVGEGRCVSQRSVLTEELQPPSAMRLSEFFEEAASEQPREHAYWKKEARLAGNPTLSVKRQTAAGDDAVHVRMMRQRRSPGVQDQRHPDVCAQMSGIGGDGAQGFGSDLKEQPVDYRLVVIRDRGDRCWQGEDYVVVVHRQQFALAGLQPMSRGSALALRAVPVTAGNGELPITCLMVTMNRPGFSGALRV